ncbi:MAG: hypothetical protein IT233_02335 [Bacteroidia bacterium]|nr:hypothetical protein [Bacteroidia bacterium]
MKFSLSFTFAFLLLGGGGMYAQTNTFPSNGNTGVGTTNPGEKLEVVGNIKVTGDLVVGGLSRLKSNVIIEGPLRLKPFTLNYQAPDRLLGVNAMGVVTVNPSIDRLNVYRIAPVPGDSIIRFGDSTLLFYPYNRIWADQTQTVKGIGISGGTSLGALAVALGKTSASGDHSISLGYQVRAAGFNAVVIGSNPTGSPTYFTNYTTNSLMVGFNSDRPTLYVSSSGGAGTTGVVCIGTTVLPNGPQYKLAVAGTILSHEVEVVAPTQWPDYVFEKDYKLMSLDERKAYLEKHRHLPYVSSAEELGKNGIAVAEMFKSLTKNIEELNLYIFQQQEQIRTLEKRLLELEQKAK